MDKLKASLLVVDKRLAIMRYPSLADNSVEVRGCVDGQHFFFKYCVGNACLHWGRGK